ncbi:type II toxin-antitoxin system HipA family toxin [Aminobacter aminovorans]|nr:type II toxin-antitoxin system HipA family toxin [Aminobacter aminovorans]
MTPLYDVLTAQPSLDQGQVPRKKFKLAMSVGKTRHYAIHDIVPRHFMQTADIAGVGTPTMKAIFEDIQANAERQAQAVNTSMPCNFPDQLMTATMAAISPRVRLIAGAMATDSHR